jgi:hypothetical protein
VIANRKLRLAGKFFDRRDKNRKASCLLRAGSAMSRPARAQSQESKEPLVKYATVLAKGPSNVSKVPVMEPEDFRKASLE